MQLRDMDMDMDARHWESSYLTLPVPRYLSDSRERLLDYVRIPDQNQNEIHLPRGFLL